MHSTRYEGPEFISRLRIGGRELKLVRPADPDRLLQASDVLDWNRRDDYMPYWAYLWPGAFLLAEAISGMDWPKDTEALEIGSGLGLAGLAGLASGLRVRFTDYDETPLQFVARSAAENGFPAGSYATGRLDWRDLPEEQYPVILGADVLYERRLVPLVATVIDRMLAPGGLALLAGPYRVATEDLPGQLEPRGLVAEAEPVEALDERGSRVRGTLHRIRRRD